jgi:penicillin G amidase
MPIECRNRALWTVVAATAIATASIPASAGGLHAQGALQDLARGALARIDGESIIQGLRQPVEIIRDEWGIPHIYAANTDDLFFAQGYVMAQDRLWQMEMWRRWREGRLAEIFGPEAFDYDVRTRLMMFRGPWDDAEWTSYHPEGERIFTAYANGVNAFIELNGDNLPVEFQLTGIRPDPWSAETVVLRWAQIGLSSVRGHAINEIELAMDVARYGAEEANRRFAPDPWDDLVVPDGLDVELFTQELLTAARAGDGDPFLPGRLPPLEIVETHRSFASDVSQPPVSSPWDPADAGSNNWVMSGSRTPSGVPILANDPHRRIEMPALRYFIHLNAPGWNVMGGGEPPFVGVDAGHNERMAWGFTFAGTDMVDLYVEELHPDDPNLVRWENGWEPLRVITEEIRVKGEPEPRAVELKFSRHGPVFYEDLQNGVAFAVRSVIQEPGTAPYLGSFQLAQATSCTDFFDRAMNWKVPTHSLICGDVDGNIALQVSGLTPDRDGWNGRLPVPGDGRYEWRGFRSDLPREMNPARGYIATANDNVHPAGYAGRPVFYHTTRGVELSRITRLHQILGSGQRFSVDDHRRIQHDAFSLRAARDQPAFRGWSSADPEVERARSMIAAWDAVLAAESTAAAIYVRWTGAVDDRTLDPRTPDPERRALTESALRQVIDRVTGEWGGNWSEWRYGRIHTSELTHMFVPAFDLPPVERPGGFNTVNATGASFRRIIDLADLNASVGTIAPGQSAQPESPFYDNLRDKLHNGEYFPLLFGRDAVEAGAAHRLTLLPEG